MTTAILTALLVSFGLVTTPAFSQQLEFSSAPSAGLDFAKAAMAAESGSNTGSVSVAHVDFNGDGRHDVFAFSDSSYFCGSAGCDPRIYVATKKGWKEVPILGDVMANSAPGEWFLTNSRVNDWQVLVVERNGVDAIALTWEDGVYLASAPQGH